MARPLSSGMVSIIPAFSRSYFRLSTLRVEISLSRRCSPPSSPPLATFLYWPTSCTLQCGVRGEQVAAARGWVTFIKLMDYKVITKSYNLLRIIMLTYWSTSLKCNCWGFGWQDLSPYKVMSHSLLQGVQWLWQWFVTTVLTLMLMWSLHALERWSARYFTITLSPQALHFVSCSAMKSRSSCDGDLTDSRTSRCVLLHKVRWRAQSDLILVRRHSAHMWWPQWSSSGLWRRCLTVMHSPISLDGSETSVYKMKRVVV